jgi:hypothetical protein
MLRHHALLFAAAAAFTIATAGCKRSADAPSAAATAAAAAATGGNGATAGGETRRPGQGAAEAGLDARAPLIYVDGEPRAAFAYNELPSTLKLGADHRALVCDYFRVIGADCGTIRQVDFHVAGRVVTVPGSELRRAGKLRFHFAGDLSGKPRLEGKLAPGDLDDVLIWSHATPSRILRDDGRRGVRVNVDGRLAAKIKRNLLEGNVDPVAEPLPGQAARYRLVDFLASRSLDIERIRGIDLVVRDERVVRLTPEEVAGGVEFMAPDKGHGEMTFVFGSRTVSALAVDVWAESDPPARLMRTLALGDAAADRGRGLHAALGQAQERR